jgi:hypothetical protein
MLGMVHAKARSREKGKKTDGSDFFCLRASREKSKLRQRPE